MSRGSAAGLAVVLFPGHSFLQPIETLEDRRLLSASAIVAHPESPALAAGHQRHALRTTPSQIKTAYGFGSSSTAGRDRRLPSSMPTTIRTLPRISESSISSLTCRAGEFESRQRNRQQSAPRRPTPLGSGKRAGRGVGARRCAGREYLSWKPTPPT